MKTSKTVAVVFATATALIWGLSFLSIKVAVTVVPPFTLGLARFVIACAILLAVFALKRRMPRLRARDLPLMLWSSVFGVTFYFVCENNGILRLSASEASIIIGTIPVLTMLAEPFIAKTRLSAPQYAGAGLSVVGVALLVVESLRLSPEPMGYAFMAGAALSWVAYSFLTKPLLATYDSLEVTFWQSLFGAIGFIPLTFAESADWSAVTPVVALNVVYLGVFCSAIGYLFYMASLEALGPTVSSVFINLIPVVSVAASFLILGERLTVAQLAGGVVAIAGVYLATMAGGRRNAEPGAGPSGAHSGSP